MTVWHSRRCPRCGGDLYLDEDETGKFYLCFQCAREYPIQYIERLAAERKLAVAGARN